jgi:hypothetical protein
MGPTLIYVLVFPSSDHFMQNIYPGISEKVHFLIMNPVDKYTYLRYKRPLSGLKWDSPAVDGPLVRLSITIRYKLVEVSRVNYVKENAMGY